MVTILFENTSETSIAMNASMSGIFGGGRGAQANISCYGE